eukprot:gnl/MRDRNA2_/MRDRNA2_233899_c0_seq1.p2 gnl/MRDRNA2_/MRDRNA2_233899_c0~~gnl/MRDRNA2_/MRDRNA2_233899_c0_seq1.p2  ORF type:complete len:145 (-),score=12.27 gnl/MRDRNA2_/MRDRNA2_233899_c0_seq1:123-557(-)
MIIKDCIELHTNKDGQRQAQQDPHIKCCRNSNEHVADPERIGRDTSGYSDPCRPRKEQWIVLLGEIERLFAKQSTICSAILNRVVTIAALHSDVQSYKIHHQREQQRISRIHCQRRKLCCSRKESMTESVSTHKSSSYSLSSKK